MLGRSSSIRSQEKTDSQGENEREREAEGVGSPGLLVPSLVD